MLCSEIVPHDTNHSNLGEVTGGQREVGGSAAQHILDAARGRGNGIESDGTNGNNAHQDFLSRYLSRIKLNFFRAAAGIVPGSVRRACASAEPHLQPRCCGICATVSRTTLQAFSAFFMSTATT